MGNAPDLNKRPCFQVERILRKSVYQSPNLCYKESLPENEKIKLHEFLMMEEKREK